MSSMNYSHNPARSQLFIFFNFKVGKEMLTIKPKDGEEPSFNLLMELLRGEH